MELNSAINEMYAGREKLIILGLTGRTGSGCSTVSNILGQEEFSALDIKEPKGYDFKNSEERKNRVIYEYMKQDGRWKGFTTIEVSSLILAAALELGMEAFEGYIDKITSEENEKIISIGDKDSKLKKVLHNLDYMFQKIRNLKLSDFSPKGMKNLDGYYRFYTREIKEYKNTLKNALEEFTCFEIKSNKMIGKHQEQYHLYTFLMQQMGNNVRCSGNPFDNEFGADKYREFISRVDVVIAIIAAWNEKRGISSTRICIDALRNPYEALFFKDKYRSFHMMAISTEDEERKRRLSGLNEKELNNLDAVEYPQKMKIPQEVFYHQNIQGCLEIADIHIYNPHVKGGKYFELTEQLLKYVALMLHPGLVTPTHLERCMQLAYNAKYNSGCLSRQVGAVVTREDFSIQSVGWNDVPKGQVSCNLRDVCGYCQNKDSETYSQFEIENEKFSRVMAKLDLEMRGKSHGRCTAFCFKDIYNGMEDSKNQVYTRALHAEENAFLQISKYGGTQIRGGCLFTTASPCELCAKKAYQLGIREIYYIDPYPGISKLHILTFGKENNPRMNLFYGAIGEAYLDFYAPRIPIKDELEMVTGVNIKSVAKGKEETNSLSYEDIRYEEVIAEIRFENGRNNIESKRTIKAVAEKDDLDLIPKKIFWTGSTYLGTKLIPQNSDTDIKIEQINTVNTPYSYNIVFGKGRRQGEPLRYQILTTVKDEKQVMEPYFAHMVKNRTEQLTLRVVVPKGLISEVFWTVYADLEMKLKVESGRLEGNVQENEEVFTFTPPVANVNYTYSIEWKFQK